MVDGVVGDACEHLAELRLGIDVVKFGGAPQAVDGPRAFAALVQVAMQRFHQRRESLFLKPVS